MSWRAIHASVWSYRADELCLYLYAPGYFQNRSLKWRFEYAGFVNKSSKVDGLEILDASDLEDAQDKAIDRVREMLRRMLASLPEKPPKKTPENQDGHLTATFRVGPEPKWFGFEFRPAAPVKLERIEFDVPVRLHGYANGPLVAKEEIPDVRREMTTDSFCFGPMIHPPHGVVSLRLSVDGEERYVEVVFRGRTGP